jgi:GNAT superfamily N-acetyltransferase
MSAENIKYRLATPGDQAFLNDMNIVATFGYREAEADMPPVEDVFDAHPQIAEFSEGFGREGDLGLIALGKYSQPIGAVWGREYERTARDEALRDHPFEITIAIRETARRQGIGRQLLDRFAVMAWLDGKDELSLGVNSRNSARKLYEAAGYLPILDATGAEAHIGHDIPMVRQLDFGPPALRVETLRKDSQLSFAFIKLRGRNPKTINHKSTTLYSVVRGEGMMNVDGEVHELRPGVIVEVPPNTPYFDEGNVDMKAVSYPPFSADDVEAIN